MDKSQNFKLRLQGKACVCIDWANVHGWSNSLKQDVNVQKLYKYLKKYQEVRDIRFYFGTDDNQKSKNFLKKAKRLGYQVVTKPVKYILATEIEGKKIYRRKCDFDMEMCIDMHQALRENYQSFIFFTGDGDFEPLYRLLINLKKQVIVVYAPGHLGKEVWQMKQGIFKTEIKRLEVF